ncbi:phosphomethylpyrimidine synthase ThiC [Methanospirillum hungatei]|jgi:thiamine biosynthesis protein ThiC|uniref:phosphomethylpyrimidine synthase ThiC n=1 Tax=Methanospirillum hungatei TaxID=2203 RepID=UPI002C4CFCEB|nr:phosphomethylpyrimidine synthase ThiC [Methanospirillum hungatei]HOW05794.1 phosphomethylpyrimidine synthase ThiC [Methanospirillum hungatei]
MSSFKLAQTTMRSACIHDEWDKAQILELSENIRLAHIAHKKGVQVIIEGGRRTYQG